MPLACVWHEEQWFYIAGPVPNDVRGVADRKQWHI